MTTPTLLPEIEAAIADAGQALVDAWDSAQGGPPHRFAVYVDPEGDPEVAAGWMAMARFHAWAIAAAEQRGYSEGRAGAIAECKAAGALYVLPDAEDVIEAFRAATWSEALCSLHSDGAPVQVVQAAIDAAENLRAIAADKAALDATWRAHDLERDAEVAQAQAATHEACAALQAICAALHVTPPTGSTYCAEAVAMVLAALTGADAPNPTQCGAVDMLRGTICPTCGARKEFAPGPPTGEPRRQMDAAAVEMCADCAALTGAGGGR